MKNNKILIIVLVLLVAIAIYFTMFFNNKSTDKVLMDFRVEDTASINKMFLVDKANQQILLEKKKGFWTVNKEYTARKDFINILLKTIYRVGVKAPVPKTKQNTVLKNMATGSIKIEIYTEKGKIKTYYVGGATADNMGTYMLLENSSEPFVVEIPGFTGFLTSRYSTNIVSWRDKSVFQYNLNSISSISVEYPKNKEKSFIALSLGNNKYELRDFYNNTVIKDVNELKIKTYVSTFKNVHAESFVVNLNKDFVDSTLASTPLAIFKVKDIHGNEKVLETFIRPNFGNLLDDQGELFKHDYDRLYGYIKNTKELVLIQYYVFDPLLSERSYFIDKKD